MVLRWMLGKQNYAKAKEFLAKAWHNWSRKRLVDVNTIQSNVGFWLVLDV